MSYDVFFEFSIGLRKTLQAPAGSLAEIKAHVAEVERTLGLKQTSNGPGHATYWDYATRPDGKSAADMNHDLLCRTVSDHNAWVREIYQIFGEWSKGAPEPSETISPEDAAAFWHGLTELVAPPSRWSSDYYRERMEHVYEVMRGRKDAGVVLGAPSLSPKQAAAVIRIFSEYLPDHDLRLDAPHGKDFLASSSDGGYDWCETCCRPMIFDEAVLSCKRRKCALKDEITA